MRQLALLLIRCYQRTISPDHGLLRLLFVDGCCRFVPSCSAYAHRAVARHGLLYGARLAAWRLARCHPWSAGGFDPVPEPSDATRQRNPSARELASLALALDRDGES
jgi:hypothetical protein